MEWITIITTFLQPILLKCFDRQSTEDPQEVLREAYDTVSGKMDSDVVNDAIPQTRRAVNKARRSRSKAERKEMPRYNREQLYEMTEKILIDSMNAPPEAVAQVRSVAATLRDDED